MLLKGLDRIIKLALLLFVPGYGCRQDGYLRYPCSTQHRWLFKICTQHLAMLRPSPMQDMNISKFPMCSSVLFRKVLQCRKRRCAVIPSSVSRQIVAQSPQMYVGVYHMSHIMLSPSSNFTSLVSNAVSLWRSGRLSGLVERSWSS